MTIASSTYLLIARILKFFNAPHMIKYLYFILILKNNNIKATSKIGISNYSISLNIGDFIEYWIFVDGLYEKNWINKIVKYVAGKTFLDVGANIGAYSLSLAKSAKKVYAFEPLNESRNKLNKSLSDNNIDNITVINKAVSSTDNRKMKLYINPGDKGQSSLSIKFSSRYQLVQTIQLDSFIKSNNIRSIGLIKIDVEGYEAKVLQGLSKTISKRHPAILVELNKIIAEKSGSDILEIYTFLNSRGYTGETVNGKIVSKNDLKNKTMNTNVLFLHRNNQNSHPRRLG